MRITGIIPARYQSSRFPGKPLADLCGKPLIWHVYNSACKFDDWDDLVVATDDSRIESECKKFNIPAIMTRNDHPDCIDRASEVAAKIKSDRYIVIQGDEPLFDSRILNVDLSPSVVNFYTQVSLECEIDDPNAVKVIVSKNLRAIYYSRYAIPYHNTNTRKSTDPFNIDKQIGLYSFSSEALRQFSALGMSYLEGIEGIGMLRFIENDIDVHMRYAQYDSVSVDTVGDLKRVEAILEGGLKLGQD